MTDTYDGPHPFHPFRSPWLAAAVVAVGLVTAGAVEVYHLLLWATGRPTAGGRS